MPVRAGIRLNLTFNNLTLRLSERIGNSFTLPIVSNVIEDNMSHNPISINYSDERLRILVEEYITQQKDTFTLKGVCSYVLYWAMEEGRTICAGLYDSDQMRGSDSNRIKHVLDTIVGEGRIAKGTDSYQILNS